MPVLIARLNLRQNWSIVLSLGLIIPLLFAVSKIYSARPYRTSIYGPSPGIAVDYEELITNYNGFPENYVVLIFVVMVLAICAAIWKPRPNWVKLCVAFLTMGTCFMVSGFWLLFITADGTFFAHISTQAFKNNTYHLVLVHLAESGGRWNEYWVFRCDEDNSGCRYNDIQNEIELFPKSIPEAQLIADELTNTLYLQIGDEKTLIAQ